MQSCDLSKRIYELRKERDLSQKELGALVGVSNKAVSKWETGAAIPKTDVLLKLAAVFNMSPEEFLVGTASAPSSSENYTTLDDVICYSNATVQRERGTSELFSYMFTYQRCKRYLIILLIVTVASSLFIGANLSFLSLVLEGAVNLLQIAAWFVACVCAMYTGIWYTVYVIKRLPFWMQLVCVIGAVWLLGFLILGGLLLLLPTIVKSILVLVKGRDVNG